MITPAIRSSELPTTSNNIKRVNLSYGRYNGLNIKDETALKLVVVVTCNKKIKLTIVKHN